MGQTKPLCQIKIPGNLSLDTAFKDSIFHVSLCFSGNAIIVLLQLLGRVAAHKFWLKKKWIGPRPTFGCSTWLPDYLLYCQVNLAREAANKKSQLMVFQKTTLWQWGARSVFSLPEFQGSPTSNFWSMEVNGNYILYISTWIQITTVHGLMLQVLFIKYSETKWNNCAQTPWKHNPTTSTYGSFLTQLPRGPSPSRC